MGFWGIIAFASMHAQAAPPVLWLSPSGQIEVAGHAVKARVTPGAARIRLAGGYAYDFNGTRGGILLEDAAALRLTGSMTVSVWINLRSYVNDGPGAQVLFRGDDRNGLDPYTLAVLGNGTIRFGIQGAEGEGMEAAAEIPLNRWTHVLGSFDANTGDVKIWINHDWVGFARTSKRPFEKLDAGFAPGIGIGNVQNDHGPHNQPLNGMIADLRLYDGVYTPDEVDQGSPLWDNPPAAQKRSHTVQ